MNNRNFKTLSYQYRTVCMNKILIVDDHKIALLGISKIIKSIGEDFMIEEATDYEACIALVKANQYKLITLDINLPGSNSFTLLEHILILQPTVRVLIISMNPEKVFATRFLKKGAWGYIEKSATDSEIKKAVQRILDGKKYFGEAVIEYLLDNAANKSPFSKLSDRELEVAKELITGKSLQDISQKLSLHVATISTYKTRIFEKLGIDNIIELSELSKYYSVKE